MSNPPMDAYVAVQREIDEVIGAQDPAVAAAAARRAQIQLARVASGPGFDSRRHRAIAHALRAASRGVPSTAAPLSPLTTR